MKNGKETNNRVETGVATAIFLFLVITATLVFLKQFCYDTSIFPSGMMLSIPSSQPSSNDNPKSALSVINMVPMTPTETFNEENLSEKINGKA
ncbi:MAG: hypothetical protein Q8M56_08760, partial [Desulfobacterales bacterium]|nr:hypothetical protein [Desulfobacterales bacterium]